MSHVGETSKRSISKWITELTYNVFRPFWNALPVFFSKMTGAHLVTENRHKYEIMVDGEAVLCEIWDTCPKVIKGVVKGFEYV